MGAFRANWSLDWITRGPITDSTGDRRFRRLVLIAEHDAQPPERGTWRELVPEPDRETYRRGEEPPAHIRRCINVYFDLAG